MTILKNGEEKKRVNRSAGAELQQYEESARRK